MNNWAGADTPKRADFNQDNRILDEKLGGHLENEDLRFQPQIELLPMVNHLFYHGTHLIHFNGIDNKVLF